LLHQFSTRHGSGLGVMHDPSIGRGAVALEANVCRNGMARRSISGYADERLAVIIRTAEAITTGGRRPLNIRASCRYSPLRETHRPRRMQLIGS
jgi:hypothetical protein